MKTSLRILAGASALFFTALAGSAQVFVGSDDFNNGAIDAQFVNGVNSGLPQATGRWRFQTDNANGTGNQWSETGGYLQYTTSNTSAFNRGFFGWVSPSVSSNTTGSAGLTDKPYTSSWTSSLTVTNSVLPSVNGTFSSAGYEIYTTNATNTGSNAYYGITLVNNFNATYVVSEWGKWNASLNGGLGDFDRVQNFFAVTGSSAILRMNYDGTSKILGTEYSVDGGNTFLAGSSFSLTGAQVGISAPYNNGFGLEFYASASAGLAINAGQLTFDNFAVSAIPEPSTYAALAGLGALGLAFWHRRRKVAA